MKPKSFNSNDKILRSLRLLGHATWDSNELKKLNFQNYFSSKMIRSETFLKMWVHILIFWVHTRTNEKSFNTSPFLEL